MLAKDNDEKVHPVSVISDLFQFGFLVMGPGQPSGPPRHRRSGSRAGAAGRSYARVTTDTPGDIDHSGGHA